ncbi:MAG: hypothetical protein ABIR53_02515 [Paraperlucidibaca sp.]
MATINLDDVNFALRELVRLQLAGELATEDAWRERQQLLGAVEANWADVPEQALDATAVAGATEVDASDDRNRVIDKLPIGQQLWAFVAQRLWPRLRELGLVWALLGLTIATCFYVASL